MCADDGDAWANGASFSKSADRAIKKEGVVEFVVDCGAGTVAMAVDGDSKGVVITGLPTGQALFPTIICDKLVVTATFLYCYASKAPEDTSLVPVPGYSAAALATASVMQWLRAALRASIATSIDDADASPERVLHVMLHTDVVDVVLAVVDSHAGLVVD